MLYSVQGHVNQTQSCFASVVSEFKTDKNDGKIDFQAAQKRLEQLTLLLSTVLVFEMIVGLLFNHYFRNFATVPSSYVSDILWICLKHIFKLE